MPQSIRTFEFWVVRRWALRPTSRYPPSAVFRAHSFSGSGSRADPDPDLLQERATVVERIAQVDPDLLNGLGRDRGGSDDRGYPADPRFRSLRTDAAASDRRPRVRCLDRDLASLGFEEQLVDLGLGRNQLPDRLLRLLRVDQGRGVAAHDHAAVQSLGDLP